MNRNHLNYETYTYGMFISNQKNIYFRYQVLGVTDIEM